MRPFVSRDPRVQFGALRDLAVSEWGSSSKAVSRHLFRRVICLCLQATAFQREDFLFASPYPDC